MLINNRVVLQYLLFIIPVHLVAATFDVGPTRTYTVPSQVMSLVQNGDSVLIDAGDYYGDVGVWNADNLVIMGVNGVAHLHADGNYAEGKAIWVVKGDTNFISHIEFSECQVPDHNGAGIRHEGKMLTLQHCSFHHNEMGILTLSQNPGDHILIEYSEFYENGFGDGFSHSIYVNHSSSLTVRYSYFHQARVGHHIKSRAAKHVIEYNKIIDGADGNSSRLIDLSNGGNTLIRGNILVQGTEAENGNLIGYGLEGLTEPTEYFVCINNTLLSYRHAATFFDVAGLIDTTLVSNNIIAGPGTLVRGQLYFENMYCTGDVDSVAFENPNLEQFHLSAGSPAVDQGKAYGLFDGMELLPHYEYAYERQVIGRTIENIIDLGAHEHQSTLAAVEVHRENRLLYPSISQDYVFFYENPGLIRLVCLATGRENKILLQENSLDISNIPAGWYIVVVGDSRQRFFKP